MTDTSNGHRALPWHSDGFRVFDADGIEVANTYTPDLALGSAKAVAKDIVEAANAHYVGKDARIAELERKLKRAHDTMADLHRDWTREEARVSELEEKLSEAVRRFAWASDANERFEVRIWEEQKRAEAAEARVRELEREYYLKARSVGFGWQVKADPDTFTAPDGRTFHVGQRVWHIWDEPGEFGHVTEINGGFPLVQFQFQNAEDQTHPDNLRRVWDNWDNPDIPTGTVLRDANGNSWFVGEFRLLLWTGQKYIRS